MFVFEIYIDPRQVYPDKKREIENVILWVDKQIIQKLFRPIMDICSDETFSTLIKVLSLKSACTFSDF